MPVQIGTVTRNALFRALIPTLVGVALSIPVTIRAQNIDLDQFEEIDTSGQPLAPKPRANKTGSGTSADPTAGWEEVAPSAARPARPPANRMDTVDLKPSPTAAAAPKATPVVPPQEPIATPAARSRAGVDTRVRTPAANISLDARFQDQIRELNREIATLKERVIEAKSRLLSYSQKVAQGFASGTQLYLKVDSGLGKDFIIERLEFYLDGHQIYTREFEPGETVDEILAYKGSVLPGRHRIDVEAILRGDDGLLDFGHKARLRLESGEYFAANEGKVVELDLVLFDRGGLFKAIETRPGLKFEIVERDVF
ncbi:MAG: hypothetical protein D6761_04815 [Candidatus Dadabacteria bacterium]|nr:MAG: hypothetical protein D6761_04815 [Candidatus Dadabacteria bacterium]